MEANSVIAPRDIPSIHTSSIIQGDSYTHFSPIPPALQDDPNCECVLGVDEAGRGPVLGPMVYGLFYLPTELHHSLLASTYHFDDSKVLTPKFREQLMQTLCSPSNDLYKNGGWATRVMSARDIAAGMLRRNQYNLNAQAMDATIDLIRSVIDQGINISHIYIDTIGRPEAYQKKLEKIFPTHKITVAKKADSLYPCVSAASVCAKVTRDIALEVCYDHITEGRAAEELLEGGWGSGYPSDARCAKWLEQAMHPLFGWGAECRFSWGTAKELLEVKNKSTRVTWPADGGGAEGGNIGDMFGVQVREGEGKGARNWFGRRDDIF